MICTWANLQSTANQHAHTIMAKTVWFIFNFHAWWEKLMRKGGDPCMLIVGYPAWRLPPKRTNINTLRKPSLYFVCDFKSKVHAQKSGRASSSFRKPMSIYFQHLYFLFANSNLSFVRAVTIFLGCCEFRERWHWKQPKSELSRICDGNLNGLRWN